VLLKTRLIPDPRQIRLRVYQTNSTHKSMSAIRKADAVRQGHRIPHRRAAIQGGGIHPRFDQSNQQLIASLDVSRRQMELEGYGLVANAIEIAIAIRRRSTTMH